MAYIRRRARTDGSIGYTAQVRIHKKKALIYEESKTFSRQAAAQKWAKAREVALEDPAVLAQALAATKSDFRLATLIKWYRETFRKVAKWGRNKEESLKRLESDPVGNEDALKINTAALVEFIQARGPQPRGPISPGSGWCCARPASNSSRCPPMRCSKPKRCAGS